MFDALDKYRDVGLLVLRAGIGLSMAIAHGWSKMAAGPEGWARLGGAMDSVFGIGFLPTFWGFAAAFAEFGCALLIVVGLLTRPAALILVFNMFVAAMTHILGEGSPAHALEFMVVFLTIFLIGPGKYSLDDAFGI
jgi:putative oxidoreductase